VRRKIFENQGERDKEKKDCIRRYLLSNFDWSISEKNSGA